MRARVAPVSTGLQIGVAALAGVALGAAYFAGLWWTVLHLPGMRRPWAWLAASAAARMALLLAGLSLLLPLGAGAVAAAVGGFVLARIAACRWLRTPGEVRR